jgi:hypothetical protein
MCVLRACLPLVQKVGASPLTRLKQRCANVIGDEQNNRVSHFRETGHKIFKRLSFCSLESDLAQFHDHEPPPWVVIPVTSLSLLSPCPLLGIRDEGLLNFSQRSFTTRWRLHRNNLMFDLHFQWCILQDIRAMVDDEGQGRLMSLMEVWLWQRVKGHA